MSRQLNKKIWPCSIDLISNADSYNIWNEVYSFDVKESGIPAWLKEVGIKSKAVYRSRYKRTCVEYYFHNEEDALMFKLRWA
jgi:hypothetical protein